MRQTIARALLLSAALLAASCGGGDAPADAPAPAQSAQAPQATSTDIDTASLMDWAEGAYASFFPSRQPSQTWGAYTFRFYPNGNYLAVSGDQVFIMGPVAGGNVPVLVGGLAQFTCQVAPQNCASTGSVVTGTVIGKGVALAGATVQLRDIAGVVRSTTTNASGTYSLNVAGLAPPFVLTATGRDASGATVTL